MRHWSHHCLAITSSRTEVFYQGKDGSTLFTVHFASTAHTKFELLLNHSPILVLFNSSANLTIQSEVDLYIPSDQYLSYRISNMDRLPADFYVSFKYRDHNLRQEFDEQLEKDLEAKLDRV